MAEDSKGEEVLMENKEVNHKEKIWGIIDDCCSGGVDIQEVRIRFDRKWRIQEVRIRFDRKWREFIQRLKAPKLSEIDWLGEVSTETGKKRIKQLCRELEFIDKLAGEKLT